MAGLILFFILGVWLLVAVLVAWLITKIIKNKLIRYLVMVLVIPILFLLPVGDELIAKFKFDELCSKVELYSDLENMKNKTIIYQGRVSNNIDLYPLSIVENEYVYLESETNDVALKWKSYEVKKGGWLSRTLGVFEGNPPISFNGQCGPEDTFSINFLRFNITVKDK